MNRLSSRFDLRSTLLAAVALPGGYRLFNRILASLMPLAGRNNFRVVKLRRGFMRAQIALKGNQDWQGNLAAGTQFMLAELPFSLLLWLTLDPELDYRLTDFTLSIVAPQAVDAWVEVQLLDADIRQLELDVKANGRACLEIETAINTLGGTLIATALSRYEIRQPGWYCGAS